MLFLSHFWIFQFHNTRKAMFPPALFKYHRGFHYYINVSHKEEDQKLMEKTKKHTHHESNTPQVVRENPTGLMCVLWSHRFDFCILKSQGTRRFKLKSGSKTWLCTAKGSSLQPLKEVPSSSHAHLLSPGLSMTYYLEKESLMKCVILKTGWPHFSSYNQN